MEIMGIPSITYLVSTRMMAAMIVMPIAYLISLGAGEAAAWVGSFVRSGTVSQGTWEFVFYIVTTPNDLIYSMIKGIVLSAAVITDRRSTSATACAAGRSRSAPRPRSRWRST